MGSNVEIKARIRNPDSMRLRVEALADSGPEPLTQEDTFFSAAHGRLKLRESSTRGAELIYYERADSPRPIESRFVRARCPEPQTLREALTRALGICGVVRKQRTLYRVGRTRIHLDNVEGLGSFLELEVVLSPTETVAQGTRVAHEIMEKLGLGDGDLVDKAYVDLLAETTERTTSPPATQPSDPAGR
jgi:predicted adenylyl cyclase CyaB